VNKVAKAHLQIIKSHAVGVSCYAYAYAYAFAYVNSVGCGPNLLEAKCFMLSKTTFGTKKF